MAWAYWSRDYPPEVRPKMWAVINAPTDEEAERILAVERGESNMPSPDDLDKLKAMRERFEPKK